MYHLNFIIKAFFHLINLNKLLLLLLLLLFTRNDIYLITRIIWILDSFTFSHLLNSLFQLVSRLYISTSSLCALSFCIPTSLWLAHYTLLYLITIMLGSYNSTSVRFSFSPLKFRKKRKKSN